MGLAGDSQSMHNPLYCPVTESRGSVGHGMYVQSSRYIYRDLQLMEMLAAARGCTRPPNKCSIELCLDTITITPKGRHDQS